ncbi:FAD-binding oxidoreductase [Halomicroarcula sp. F13]|uniref:FAD-binding oxidoreductase n=1 Tax=Haloarcula rubra TaxID=2487747 RepID=A0AAW4PWF0_9EURY|nr:FAD-binding oxidoreductase [Halomicroarcula rubra]MBX0326048.1 FAD-binding oxidoreductase [Halomicroarcula rubra]
MAQTTITTRDGSPTTLTGDTIEAFRHRLHGPLLVPDDDGFEEATRLWNGTIEKTPALVVQPATTDDVVTCVDLAREHDLLLGIRGGGHNIAGTALADGGLTLDMSRMNTVEVDPDTRTVTAGPGCLLGDVDAATQEYGLATVLGFVSETGLAGLVLGGGFGYLSRRFGWAVDNLVEVEIVTADGTVRRANIDEHDDLFWAVRGAGHNMGVVTEFTLRLHEVGPEITGGLLAFPAETPEQANAALDAYRAVTEAAPRELTVFNQFQRAPPAPFVPEEWHGRRIVGFLVCHTGPPERAEEDLAPLQEPLGEPVVDLIGRLPYVEQQQLTDETQPKGMHYYWKAVWTDSLDDDLLKAVGDLSLNLPSPMTKLGFVHVGGALNERDWDDGVVGNRDFRYGLGILGMWNPDDPDGDAHRAWVREAWERCRPFSTGGHYVNFETADEPADRVRAAYRDNYDRLIDIKTRYDSGNLFRTNRNVSPDPEESR